MATVARSTKIKQMFGSFHGPVCPFWEMGSDYLNAPLTTLYHPLQSTRPDVLLYREVHSTLHNISCLTCLNRRYLKMPKDSSRTPLPTSSSDFALPSSSSTSSPGASTSSVTLDDPTFLFNRLRRSSFLQKSNYLSETRLHSPLASSFTLHARRRSQTAAFIAEESESDKDRMMTDSPNSSETHTPPLKVPTNAEDDSTVTKVPIRQPPLTPPRRRSSASMDASDMPTIFNRRLSFPVSRLQLFRTFPVDASMSIFIPYS